MPTQPSPSWAKKSDMLMIATSLRQLNWSQLMALYEEGNRKNGEDLYPHLSAGQQLLHAEQDFYDYLKNGFFIQPGDRYCLWSEAGIYVSALRLERYQDGLLLEALETHPAYRGRGYAKKLVAAVLEGVDEKVYSHISPRNGPSLAVHKACGFEKILNHSVYADGSVNSRCHTYRYEKTTL